MGIILKHTKNIEFVDMDTYDDKYSKPAKIYRGSDAVYKLIENRLEEEKDLRKIIIIIIIQKKKKKKKKKDEFNKRMIITKEQDLKC